MALFSRSGATDAHPTSYLALDIGTEVVKAVVFEVSEGAHHAVVKGVGRKRQPLGAMYAGAVGDIQAVIDICEKAIFEASEQAGTRPTHVMMGVAGELVRGATTTISYEREQPEETIDEPELRNIMHTVQWKALDKVRNELAKQTGQEELDIRLITGAVVEIRIDGYRITQPVGFKGQEIALSVFNAYAPLVHIGALESIAQGLELTILGITAEPYAVATAVGVGERMEYSGLFIDVGGGTTDIAVVRNGVIEGTNMFGIGGRAFTRRVMQVRDLSFDDAEELKVRYGNGLANEATAHRLDQDLAADIAVWQEGVRLSLQPSSDKEPLPSRVLLCGGGSKLPGLAQALTDQSFTSQLNFAAPPRIHGMQPSDVVLVNDATDTLKGREDVTPLALAAHATREVLSQQDEFASVMRRTLRLLQPSE